MEHRFCLDEILGKVSEMINDGYHYGSIRAWISARYACRA